MNAKHFKSSEMKAKNELMHTKVAHVIIYYFLIMHLLPVDNYHPPPIVKLLGMLLLITVYCVMTFLVILNVWIDMQFPTFWVA